MHNAFVEWVTPSLVTSLTASVLNALVIVIMTFIYTRIAWILTEFEYPRTEKAFETSYTYKVMLFQFMNYYGSLFYISLLKVFD